MPWPMMASAYQRAVTERRCAVLALVAHGDASVLFILGSYERFRLVAAGKDQRVFGEIQGYVTSSIQAGTIVNPRYAATRTF